MTKIIVNIITIAVIASILAFAGCVGKESTTPTATPSPTSTPKQVASTTTVTLTPTATLTPKETVNVTLKAGYKWYQDDDLSYKIGYPENWQINDHGMSMVTVNNISGWFNGVSFSSSSWTSNRPPEATILVFVYPNETLAKWWMQDPAYDLEKSKEGGSVTKYGNITINGREGYEVIYDPFGSKTPFVFPISKTVTISTEAASANKSMSPKITDIKLNVSRLTDENGDVKMITATTNISIYNPTSVALILEKFNYQEIAMYKKDENFRILKPLRGSFGGFYNQIIMPNDTYIMSIETTITDNDTFQYFISEEPKYIKIKGSAFLIPNETGWSPAYFEPTFNTLITITNGSDGSGEVVH
ncbi:MAG: hypothetical protein OIN88_16230 [Candidatus Methanoperedens sp.]|nr:hypothetical protein [Candidatus Methanoperedens sp.]